ncbi:leucine-rich repeat domain-containing protein [Chryseobacterium shandongense]|uniref:leucine-rich repeat domain-containing protein n=1 Tax=Chryseobacterium shandongense TaxID=1493872 RepID=UPI000F50FB86|nr:leucine-rich repeat domain-containing protein [Chryseobacterium shandongense]AZA58597.1 TIR domain-containing protein [Chryseobacterium shandongense]
MHKTETLKFLEKDLKSEIIDFNLHEDQSLECLTLDNESLSDGFLQKLSLHKNLKRLYIRECQLKTVAFLNNLLSLEELEIIDCVFPLIKSLKLENLKRLHINRCSIKNINFIQDCKKIKILILQDNKIENISVLKVFGKLDFLNLSGNKIKDISIIKNLTINMELDLSRNMIFDFSPLYNMVKNDKVNYFDFTNNPSFFPPENLYLNDKFSFIDWFEDKYLEVRYKIKLAKENEYDSLDLGCMGITDLSYFPELFELKKLKKLILSNEWAEYDDYEGAWDRGISINNIYPNNLIDIPTGISKLTNLECLIIGGDWNQKDKSNPNKWRIKKTNNLRKLESLKYLNISNNMITNIDSVVNLPELEVLHANNNSIHSVRNLDMFSNLREIYLSNNLIEDVVFLLDNTSLTTIDLHSNKITDLIPLKTLFDVSLIGIEVTSWKKNVISINHNINTNPPLSALEGGRKSFLLYVNRYEKEIGLKLTEYINNDVKVILAGNSNSGKSTLVDYLLFGKVNKKIKTTDWIERKELFKKIDNKSSVRLKFFDLGGQDYYHDTHNLFFDKDSIYLLLWENKTNILQSKKEGEMVFQNYPLEYWLDCIRIHSQNSSEMERKIDKLLEQKEKINNFTKSITSKFPENSKVDFGARNILIIQSKTEKDKFFLNQLDYQVRYPLIKDFINISTYNEKGLSLLNDFLLEMVRENPLFNKKLLNTWGLIKDNLSNIVKGVEVALTIDQLLDRFNEFIASSFRTSALTTLEIETLMFSREDIIEFTIFLNGIGDLIYRPNVDPNIVIVNQKKFIETTKKLIENAKLNDGELKSLDDEYQFKVLKDLEVIFENEGRYFFPLYLPEKPYPVVEILLNNVNIPLRKFKFSGYIPKNIILKIYSRFSKRASPSNGFNNFYFWKNGLILIDEVLGDKFYLKFGINSKSNYTFIDMFCLDHDKFSKDYSGFIDFIQEIFTVENLVVTELVTIDGEFYADLEIVTSCYEKRINFIEVNDLHDNTKVINTHIYNNFIHENLKKNMKKIFISYSKYDDDYRKEFIKHLITLKDDGTISEFNCESIDLGENSHEVIQKNLEECDYMVALVSVDFLNTDYIRKYEVKKAIELNKKIIPIIIKPCDWENSIIKDFHATLRGRNISLDQELFFSDKIKETTPIERQQNWTKIIKEFREKLFSKN